MWEFSLKHSKENTPILTLGVSTVVICRVSTGIFAAKGLLAIHIISWGAMLTNCFLPISILSFLSLLICSHELVAPFMMLFLTIWVQRFQAQTKPLHKPLLLLRLFLSHIISPLSISLYLVRLPFSLFNTPVALLCLRAIGCLVPWPGTQGEMVYKSSEQSLAERQRLQDGWSFKQVAEWKSIMLRTDVAALGLT